MPVPTVAVRRLGLVSEVENKRRRAWVCYIRSAAYQREAVTIERDRMNGGLEWVAWFFNF